MSSRMAMPSAMAPPLMPPSNRRKRRQKNQRALAEADALALNCTTARGCTCVSTQRPTVQGSGLDWTVPRKVRGVWIVKAWAYTSYYIYCKCSA